MQNLLVKLVLIGALIGAVLGGIANIAGANALDYTATYNIGVWGDDNRINKNLDENPNIPPYEKQSTVVGGAIFGLLLGALVGLITNYLKSEAAYILSAVVGFLVSAFIVSPYPFYKFVPPVAGKYVIWVLIPGAIIAVLISIFLERFKPVPLVVEPATPVPPVNQPNQNQQQGKKKNK